MITFKYSDNLTYNVNPNSNDMLGYQIKGLEADAKDPSDYLRLVARTFSSFKDRVSETSVSSYINGFEIGYDNDYIQELDVNNIPTNTNYHIFKISPGACFINNQFIEFTERTMFYKRFDEFNFNKTPNTYTDFAIIVTYGFVDQYNDAGAKIQIVPYKDLAFPLLENGDTNVCSFNDSSLSGNSTSVMYNTPGLLIGKFSLYSGASGALDAGRACTTYEPRQYNMIDYQGLDKLYMSNYKLLFEYFGSQAETVFSASGLTQSTFISVDGVYIDSSVESGDMVRIYQDPNTNKIIYLPAMASRQTFDQVVGLYLYDFQSKNHIIYLNGLVTIDVTRHSLKPTHVLFNMIPGIKYYLDNTCSIYDNMDEVIRVGDLAIADNSGKLTTKYYNGSVMIGTATACNQILININHAMEIGVQNLLELFGTSSTFKKELTAQKKYIDAEKIIEKNTSLIAQYNTNKNIIQTEIGTTISDTTILFKIVNGSDTITLFNQFDDLDVKIEKSSEMYNYLYKIFIGSSNFSDLKTINIFTSGSVFSDQQYTKIRNVFTGSDTGMKLNTNMKTLLKISKEIRDYINSVIITIDEAITSVPVNSILENTLKIKRYNLGDKFDKLDNFENYLIKSDELVSYTNDVNDLNTTNIGLNASIATSIENRKHQYVLKYRFKKYSENCNAFIILIEDWIKNNDNLYLSYNNMITKLDQEIIAYTTVKNTEIQNIATVQPLALDLFHMDEYQRKVFNYTYVTDRLKRCLYLADIILIEFNKTIQDSTLILNNYDSNITALDRAVMARKVNIVTNKKDKNQKLIDEYTIEFNNLRIDFGLEPIKKEDINYDMDAGDLIDERLGQYRFGCDDHTDCVNGVCSNMLDECSGVIYDEFAILANQTDINLGKIINMEVTVDTTVNLFRITDNKAIDVEPIITITDLDGNDKSSLFSIDAVALSASQKIMGLYKGYQITMYTTPAADNTDANYILTIDTTKHVNTLKLHITVL